MIEPIPVAFYAPLKEPDHPLPSGDRSMARLFLAALKEAGFAPEVASRLRSYEGRGDAARQRQIRDEAAAETSRIALEYALRPATAQPRLWFTYHVYYRAPDWIGPAICDRLGIPYVVAEGSRAAKRAGGDWDLAHRGAEAALDRADLVFAMTEIDEEALARSRPPHQRLCVCPPFLDIEAWPTPEPTAAQTDVRLLTVAMMRSRDKLASFRILAEALHGLMSAPWSLDIVGDGEAADEVRRMFALGERVRFHGRIEDRRRLAELYETADLFVWPAVNEAYGMALLEAQAFGCAVVAGREGGVANVVQDGQTGLLTSPGDAAAFTDALRTLIENPFRRARMCAAARRFVRQERNLHAAAARIRTALAPLLEPELCR